MKLNYRFLIYLLCFIVVILFFFIKTIDFTLKKYTRHNNVIYVPSLIGLSLSETEDTLSNINLQFSILDSAAYNPNYKRGAVLSHQPKAESEVKSGRKIYLTLNPLTVHYIPLPHLKNKSLRQAISLLENSAFIVGELHYVDYYAKDVVRFSKVNNKDVSKSDSLPKFTVVDLYLGNGYNKNVIVPDVIGLEFSQIKSKLNQNSLNLGLCYFTSRDKDTITSIIYQQEPLANEKVPLGSYIKVWLKDSLN